MINIGRIAVREGDLEKAKQYFKTALESTSDSFIISELNYNLASIYFLMP
jgi:uncharacterized protein HemY